MNACICVYFTFFIRQHEMFVNDECFSASENNDFMVATVLYCIVKHLSAPMKELVVSSSSPLGLLAGKKVYYICQMNENFNSRMC